MTNCSPKLRSFGFVASLAQSVFKIVLCTFDFIGVYYLERVSEDL
jgi:hypothetical protein